MSDIKETLGLLLFRHEHMKAYRKPETEREFDAAFDDVVHEFDALRREVARLTAERDALLNPGTCLWAYDGEGVYAAGCGLAWSFEYDGPADNNCKYCPQCGKVIEVLPAPPEGEA